MGWMARARRRMVSGLQFRKPDGADVSGFHQVGNGADGLLDGNAVVEARGAVDVDVVRSQAGQSVRQEILDGGGTPVKPEPGSIGSTEGAEFHRQENPVATAFEGAAQEHLVVPHAVEVAGIEQSDTAIEGRMDGGDTLVLI